MNSSTGVVQITVHGSIDVDIIDKIGVNNTKYLDVDDKSLFEVNDYDMILQTIKCSRMGTNYFDTIEQQYENRNILNKFLENNTNIEELVEKLKKINGKIIDDDFYNAKNDSEIKLLKETYHKPSYANNKTIGKEIYPINENVYNKLSFKEQKKYLINKRFKNHKYFSADNDDFENDKIQWNITLLYKPNNGKTKKIKSRVLYSQYVDESKLKKGVYFSDIYDKIQELMEFDSSIPTFKKLIVADFSCSPLDDILEEESTERDKRYISNILERTSSYSKPSNDYIDNY